MATFEESTVFWNPDGYVELVFIGIQEPEQLSKLNEEARNLLDAYGPANVLIDGRYGRISREASSFLILRRLTKVKNLKKMYILIDKKATQLESGRESGIVITIVSTALGLRPIYLYDEEKARKLVASD